MFPVLRPRPCFERIIIPALFILLFSWSCNKDSDLGLVVQPPGDNINVIYTDTACIYTGIRTSTETFSPGVSLGLLGSYVDPVFGFSKCEIFTQFQPSVMNVSFNVPVTAIADSLILYLDYSGYYGDTTLQQQIKVYKLTNSLPASGIPVSSLHSYYDSTQVIGDILYYPKPHDTSLVAVPLSISLAQELLSSNPDLNTSAAAFFTAHKGLYLSAGSVSSGGAIIYFNLMSAGTKIRLIYHLTGETVKKQFDFIVEAGCSRFNIFKHDYTGTPFYSRLNAADPIQDSVTYIQSIGGVRTFIKFPFLDKWRNNGKYSVAKAELLIYTEQKDLTASTYYCPNNLLLDAIESDTTIEALLGTYGADYFDGSYDYEIRGYKIYITKYIQQVINGERENRGLMLYPWENKVNSCRAVLTGSKHSKKMKLAITYTKY